MRTLLNVNEAAKILHIHPMSLRQLVSKRKIPFIKRLGIGVKFDPDRLESWIREGEIEPGSKRIKKKNSRILKSVTPGETVRVKPKKEIPNSN